MASGTLYADNYVAAFTDGDRVSPACSGGTVHVVSDTYRFVSSTAGSTLTIGAAKIPKGARILGAEIRTDAAGASVTFALAVGSLTLISATSVSTAGTYRQDIGVLDTAVPADAYPIITTAGATTGAAVDVEVLVFYTFH